MTASQHVMCKPSRGHRLGRLAVCESRSIESPGSGVGPRVVKHEVALLERHLSVLSVEGLQGKGLESQGDEQEQCTVIRS